MQQLHKGLKCDDKHIDELRHHSVRPAPHEMSATAHRVWPIYNENTLVSPGTPPHQYLSLRYRGWGVLEWPRQGHPGKSERPSCRSAEIYREMASSECLYIYLVLYSSTTCQTDKNCMCYSSYSTRHIPERIQHDSFCNIPPIKKCSRGDLVSIYRLRILQYKGKIDSIGTSINDTALEGLILKIEYFPVLRPSSLPLCIYKNPSTVTYLFRV